MWCLVADMRRTFQDRAHLIDYLKEQFPQTVEVDARVSDIQGGRRAAERRLAQAETGLRYRKTRDYLDGAVSGLSPYIRYGVLGLAEVRDYALIQSGPHDAEKFINELATRDYWQLKYAEIGDDIWEDVEDYKTGFAATTYTEFLPDDIRTGQTGITFIDDLCRELFETGYIHNRGRMWLAAYVVHWRRVRWQAGARWFLEHLLDGDPASNNLSWQWVASTFSSKPYYYNLDNVIKFSGDRYKGDPAELGHQDFDTSYEELAQRLFPNADVYQDNARQGARSGRRHRGGRR